MPFSFLSIDVLSSVDWVDVKEVAFVVVSLLCGLLLYGYWYERRRW